MDNKTMIFTIGNTNLDLEYSVSYETETSEHFGALKTETYKIIDDVKAFYKGREVHLNSEWSNEAYNEACAQESVYP